MHVRTLLTTTASHSSHRMELPVGVVSLALVWSTCSVVALGMAIRHCYLQYIPPNSPQHMARVWATLMYGAGVLAAVVPTILLVAGVVVNVDLSCENATDGTTTRDCLLPPVIMSLSFAVLGSVFALLISLGRAGIFEFSSATFGFAALICMTITSLLAGSQLISWWSWSLLFTILGSAMHGSVEAATFREN